MLRWLAGLASVLALKTLSLIPLRFIVLLGFPFLPLYIFARRNVRHRLRSLRGPSPFDYYRTRLRLAALSLRHLTGHWTDVPIRIEGEEHYRSALATGRPVALLGWHQGPVELLHHVPPAPTDGRPFFIATAGGFSPPLTRFMQRGRKQPGKQVVEIRGVPNALRSWARHRGVLAVMLDQVPGKPEDRLSLWNETAQISFTRNLWDWIVRRKAVLLAVSVRLLNDGSILFRYDPVPPDEDGFRKLMESSLVETADQYNWSYPKIRITSV